MRRPAPPEYSFALTYLEARHVGYTLEYGKDPLTDLVIERAQSNEVQAALAEYVPRTTSPDLNEGEINILQAVADGKTEKEIGAYWNCTPVTARLWRANLCKKLGSRTVPELMRRASEQKVPLTLPPSPWKYRPMARRWLGFSLVSRGWLTTELAGQTGLDRKAIASHEGKTLNYMIASMMGAGLLVRDAVLLGHEKPQADVPAPD